MIRRDAWKRPAVFSLVQKEGNIPEEDMCKLVIAYEPVWAIGTGKTATPEIADGMHLVIRNQLSKLYSTELSNSISILYGGSVKPDNIDSLMSQENIDGALVGGASLDSESFNRIVNFTCPSRRNIGGKRER